MASRCGTASVNRMLVDLKKDGNAAHVQTLGLTSYMAELVRNPLPIPNLRLTRNLHPLPIPTPARTMMMKGDWRGERPPLPLWTLPPPTVAQGTALPSLRHRLTFSQSSKGLVRPSLYGGE